MHNSLDINNCISFNFVLEWWRTRPADPRTTTRTV